MNGALAGNFKLNAYFHGQGHPLADLAGDQTRVLVKLTLQGATPIYGAPSVHPYYLAYPGDTGVPVEGVAFGFTLQASDLVNTGNPEADRPATLLNIATRGTTSAGQRILKPERRINRNTKD